MTTEFNFICYKRTILSNGRKKELYTIYEGEDRVSISDLDREGLETVISEIRKLLEM